MLCSLPQDYPKLSQSYYSLLEVLTQDHMNFIASLEPHVIMYILSSISEGLTALGKRSAAVGLEHPRESISLLIVLNGHTEKREDIA